MSTPVESAAYDPFAWFYDRYWNERFHSRAWPVVELLLIPKLRAGAAVLDAGCGTGYLARLFVRRGFRVTGLDASPGMLAYARQHVPEAAFHVADLRNFQLEGAFDAVLCTFDTLNHLLSPEDLTAAFRSVVAALAPGGFFLFDMLLEEAYREHWEENFSIVEPDHVLIIDGQGFDARHKMAHCHVTAFRLIKESWQRADTVISERCYTRDEIWTALAAAGFPAPACFDARDLGMAGDLGVGRVFFLLQKPN